jgi:hypothetical protein
MSSSKNTTSLGHRTKAKGGHQGTYSRNVLCIVRQMLMLHGPFSSPPNKGFDYVVISMCKTTTKRKARQDMAQLVYVAIYHDAGLRPSAISVLFWAPINA